MKDANVKDVKASRPRLIIRNRVGAARPPVVLTDSSAATQLMVCRFGCGVLKLHEQIKETTWRCVDCGRCRGVDVATEREG